MLFRCHKIIYILVKLKNKRQSIMYEIQCNVQLYKLFKIKKEEEGGGSSRGLNLLQDRFCFHASFSKNEFCLKLKALRWKNRNWFQQQKVSLMLSVKHKVLNKIFEQSDVYA